MSIKAIQTKIRNKELIELIKFYHDNTCPGEVENREIDFDECKKECMLPRILAHRNIGYIYNKKPCQKQIQRDLCFIIHHETHSWNDICWDGWFFENQEIRLIRGRGC